jgi:hypothetical protein
MVCSQKTGKSEYDFFGAESGWVISQIFRLGFPMTWLETVDEIAKAIRHVPYNLLKNDCITELLRFKRMCKFKGIEARMVVCISLKRAR